MGDRQNPEEEPPKVADESTFWVAGGGGWEGGPDFFCRKMPDVVVEMMNTSKTGTISTCGDTKRWKTWQRFWLRFLPLQVRFSTPEAAQR